MLIRSLSRRACLLLLALCAMPAWAAMTIEIVGGGANRIPIAAAAFAAPAGVLNPAEVIGADLQRSGLFRLVDGQDVRPQPVEPQQVSFPVWRGKGADALVIGQVIAQAGNRYEVRFRLLDVVKGQQLLGMSYTVPAQNLRLVAHKIADAVYEKLTGEPGVFSTRIAYVLKRGGRYELQVADVDGYNAVTIASSPESLMSPAWSPDGSRLAYVSFEDRKPVVYVQNIFDGRRRAVARFKGSNSAPAWSPDGRQLAVVLSKDESSQIYLIDLEGGAPRRLMSSSGLDTEPAFSPDGHWLYFTSDRGGSPQIYRMPLAGGAAQRLTFEGGYNVSPALSPDGKTMAFLHRRDGRFLVAVMDLATGQSQVLTDTDHDESPSFAPNGRMILYATRTGNQATLATVSVDGQVKQRLSQSGDLREPAWAPLKNQ
ncbi:TolB protein [Sulfuritortus calidifontis]|uniref:Tol-Pal system protein TolB n=1 Tax=Sulfuritortus calidifontis TaxID=1914471 RepID=A0A4R3JZ13_9PROT|nr:Tol-Pal system beta propeller repeat protein TolB [Sulfuritortus calidifontis]TCS74063.1 TolB protein [Sulfuritortus calidifontis]